jgi:type IV pilus assembly protein PilN
MIRINLLPADEVKRVAETRQDMAVGALVVVVTLLLFVSAHAWQEVWSLATSRELARVNRELEEIHGPFLEISKMEKQRHELREKLQVISDLETKTGGPVRVLAELSRSTPDRLWLTDFAEASGQVQISGLGVDEQTVADFLINLGESKFFKDVDLQQTLEVDQSGIKQKKFVIVGRVDYLGRGQKADDKKADGKAADGAKANGTKPDRKKTIVTPTLEEDAE